MQDKVLLRLSDSGFSKIALNRLIRQVTGLGLAKSKELVDQLLENGDVVVDVPEGLTKEFIAKATKLGLKVCIEQ